MTLKLASAALLAGVLLVPTATFHAQASPSQKSAAQTGTAPQTLQSEQAQLAKEEKANQQQAKAEKAERKALKQQQKAAKAAKKAGTASPAAPTP